ncbi:MAG: TfoX/Sxy family protein [Acidimicrobiia bacterium]|nr:TfoX/Sxy family protein [Acidimicrobiia bacterium]
MGEKGARLTGDTTETAAQLVDALASLGDVTSKKMFGGYGIFGDGVMFALIDSAGIPHLRTDESTTPQFEDAGSVKHSRMPYWSIPEAVLSDDEQLTEWATEAFEVAKAAKK